ncbi:MAG TPA: long-chain fatty acid--CoA ligase [Smithella sp.]|nr:long-chain fatty acid--CoA ligase [Smithella sp.]MDM7988469.1 long-chain fatty acid--CoA ligase [Smithella sp.]HNY50376.1 long-chain fatty acid--CoA ligase [Smithella sp.]HOG88973.1 long-chain fatty acid--CoA ligase [Smithella sp.]HOU51526.1 long-chain fatty acid--CoA ligase [Smithella sp.]
MAEFQETSMGAIFQNRVQQYGDKTLVIYKNSKSGQWEEISWTKLNEMVRNLGMFLIKRGIKPGDKVALFSPNRYEWWVADLAIISVGAVNVPIYATNSAEESRYIIDNSDSRMCFVGTKEHMAKIIKVKEKLPNLGEIIIFDDSEKPPAGVMTLAEAMKEGSATTNKDEFDKRIKPINMDDVATIIYTSGTTGNPKGVMLTHKNFVSNVNQINAVDPEFLSDDHTFLSFLPLAHSLERTVGYYAAIFLGKKVAFAESTDKLLENFKEIRPTVLVSVPRIYEKVHAGILAKVATASPVKKALFNWAMGLAKENLPYICENRKRTGWFAFKYNLADKLIFSKLKEALGMDKLKGAVSGGGPLSVSDAEFFLGMGIIITEGYGLTETTPVTNSNKPKKIKPGTVGPAVKDTIVKIGEGGEILIKGPQVMKGYYKNEEATKEVFTSDGFFRTGDIGEIDSDGYMKITGRIKDIIVTSGGKNISPQNIENTLITSPFIEQIAVIGDNRKYLSALIVPAFASLESWAKEKGIAFSNRHDLTQNPEVIKLYEQEIQEYMKDYARVEQIRKFILLEKEWSQDSGELTPTMKLKRSIIRKKFEQEIESMYPPE